MSTRLDDIPEDVRDRAVSRDDALGSMEKELRMTCPNDTDYCHVGTEIPTIIKWLQSIEESTFEWVRVDEDGSIIGCYARVPKGVVKLQGSARKSNRHNQMVSYGPYR